MIQASSSTLAAAATRLPGQRYEPVHEVAKTIEHTSAAALADTPKGFLSFPIGKGSVAGAINDSLRFRVEGDGPMQSRTLVPDSESAALVANSTAGPKLLKILGTAVASLAGNEKRQDLSTFVLPKNVDGVVATSLLQNAKANAGLMNALAQPESRSDPRARQLFQEQRASVTDDYRRGVAAWNANGTIIFRPDVARMILTSAGAYSPQKGDSEGIRSAKWAAELVNHVPTHEAQHSASPVSDKLYATPGKWLEESVAEALSDTPAVLARTAEKTGINPKSYAGQLAHESTVPLGWKGWSAGKASKEQRADNETSVGRNYEASQDALRDLLSSAGHTFGTVAQTKRAGVYIQDVPAEMLPDKLATTLVKRWNIDPSRTADLSKRISSVVDDEGGVAKLKKDFGIG
jgi:hypothetical protein